MRYGPEHGDNPDIARLVQTSDKPPGTTSSRSRLGEEAMAESEIPIFIVFQESIIAENPGKTRGLIGCCISDIDVFTPIAA